MKKFSKIVVAVSPFLAWVLYPRSFMQRQYLDKTHNAYLHKLRRHRVYKMGWVAKTKSHL